MRLVPTFESHEALRTVFVDDVRIGDVKPGSSVGYLVYSPGEDSSPVVRARFTPMKESGQVEVAAFAESNGEAKTALIDGDIPASDALLLSIDLIWDAYLS